VEKCELASISHRHIFAFESPTFQNAARYLESKTKSLNIDDGLYPRGLEKLVFYLSHSYSM